MQFDVIVTANEMEKFQMINSIFNANRVDFVQTRRSVASELDFTLFANVPFMGH